MAASPAHELDFFRRLLTADISSQSRRSALAYARICRDLLIRTAAAWSAQHGLEAVPFNELPGLELLFQAALGNSLPEHTGSQRERSADRLDGLLHDLAAWLLSGFDERDPVAASYQVWVGREGESTIRLSGLERTIQPPDGFSLDSSAGQAHSAQLNGAAVCIGHYDVHGISALALTLRTLRQAGVEASGVLGFEQTGDIGKLWKRTVPQALKSQEDGANVLLIDCPVHSRTPEHTLKALRLLDNLPAASLTIIDHHPDTIAMAPLLARKGVQLVLTDVLSCALLGEDDAASRELRLLGAIGDKVPEVASAYSAADYPALYNANSAYHAALLHFSPTPKPLKAAGSLACEALWEALAEGQPVQPGLAALVMPRTEAAPPAPATPAYAVCGSVLFVTDRLTVLGRSWYDMLERLMERAGVSYAVALRLLDGNRANMLLLTHWQHTHMPPVRGFIPAAWLHRTLGHPAAVWVDLDRQVALGFLAEVAANINEFLDTPADFASLASVLQQNILDGPASEQAIPGSKDTAPGEASTL